MTQYGTGTAITVDTTPLTLSEMKLHLRVESAVTADDDLITSLIIAATEWCQNFQGRKYITQTVVKKYYRFPDSTGTIYLPYPPLVSVTSITYVDSAGETHTLSASRYTVDTTNEPGCVVPAYNQIWPAARGHINDVTITYTAGYGAAAGVPDQVKAAIKMLVAHWYENREAVVIGAAPALVPLGVEALLWQERYNVI